MTTIFEKKYDSESLYDLTRDVSEALEARFNLIASEIPTDEHGFQQGTFTVKIEWTPE